MIFFLIFELTFYTGSLIKGFILLYIFCYSGNNNDKLYQV